MFKGKDEHYSDGGILLNSIYQSAIVTLVLDWAGIYETHRNQIAEVIAWGGGLGLAKTVVLAVRPNTFVQLGDLYDRNVGEPAYALTFSGKKPAEKLVVGAKKVGAFLADMFLDYEDGFARLNSKRYFKDRPDFAKSVGRPVK